MSRPDISTSKPLSGAAARHLAYRPEIDGLRAFSVLSVVLYHFGVPGLDGGFVGVDIFFVISGFLIGGLLWSELRETGRIDLGRFYMRRMRRLAPAFFAMAIASSVFAWLVLLPFEFREFGKSLIAATVWLSNVQFWREAGYFDVAAESKPLLHTWSLSVEEQFYVFLPLALLALRIVRGATIPALILIWLVSAVACIAMTPTYPEATFFLFPFRAWELLTGVLLAIALRNQSIRPWPGLSWIGLALVAVSIIAMRSDGFPGWQAILPVAGAALILANAGQDNLANRLLALKGPVFVGLISYSLYLWHWPVLILSRYWRDGYASPFEAAGWLALATILAILSWALVERPLRHAHWIGAPAFLGGSIAVGLVVLTFGGLIYVRDGVANRFPPEVRAHIDASQDFLQDWSRCDTAASGPLAGIETCDIGPEGAPKVLIWGDSHLRALMDGLALAADEAGTPGMIIWRGGCPPLFGVAKDESASTPSQDASCLRANNQLEQAFAQMDSVERILLVGRWSYYAEGTGIGRDAANLITLRPAPGSGLQADNQAVLFDLALEETVKTLNDDFGEVHVLRQVPEIPDYSSREVARMLAHGRASPSEITATFSAKSETLAARVMGAETCLYPMATKGLITLIDPWPRLCPERCSVMMDGKPVYFDNNHINNAGARALRDLFMPFLTGTVGS